MARTDSTPVIDRAFAVLQCCARSRRTLSLADLVGMTGLPKTTLHRICWKLEELGALERFGDGFRIGPMLFALGAINPTVQRLRTQAMPFLHHLSEATNLVAALAVMVDNRALLVDEVFADERPLPRMVGGLLPLHASAPGKALLAAEPIERQRSLLAGPLERFTPRTVTDPEQLIRELAGALKTGVVFSRGEWTRDVWGVAAPILPGGRATGAITLAGITRPADAERHAHRVLQAAKGTAAALYRPVIRDSGPADRKQAFADLLNESDAG